MEQINGMVEKLKMADTKEQMVELENRIADMLGRGFLQGRFNYENMQGIKLQVEQIEKEKRKSINLETVIHKTGHAR